MRTLKDQMVAWIKDYFAKNGDANTKALIGISGGKDSTVVAAACVAALGKDRVVGVMMPNGVQTDINDSKRVCEFLGIKNYEINIKGAYEALAQEITTKTAGEATAQFKTNTPSRLRMATLRCGCDYRKLPNKQQRKQERMPYGLFHNLGRRCRRFRTIGKSICERRRKIRN